MTADLTLLFETGLHCTITQRKAADFLHGAIRSAQKRK